MKVRGEVRTQHCEVRLVDDSGAFWTRRCACGDRWPCDDATDRRHPVTSAPRDEMPETA